MISYVAIYLLNIVVVCNCLNDDKVVQLFFYVLVRSSRFLSVLVLLDFASIYLGISSFPQLPRSHKHLSLTLLLDSFFPSFF